MSHKHKSIDVVNIGDIRGDFWVADYQRGYRWSEEVARLLEDLASLRVDEKEKFCLQPVVVKRIERAGKHLLELVDGQQRVTTVYLILKWISVNCIPAAKPAFSIAYETRPDSQAFLSNIENKDERYETQDIDEIFLLKAYRNIGFWFETQGNQLQSAIDLLSKLNKQVSVIWYEPEDEDAVDLFTRLNIGRIRLTNAELVKALFLERDCRKKISNDRQIEIATYWDMFEQELRDDRFWAFLTNKTSDDYPTRFELILDLYVKKPAKERDVFWTFFQFSKMMDAWSDAEAPDEIRKLWDGIVTFYGKLKALYAQPDYYHWIGYLIAEGAADWADVLAEEERLPKNDFCRSLRRRIARSIDTKALYGTAKNYSELSYENGVDQGLIKRLLLLFNVETIRRGNDRLKRFPFYLYKNKTWSLEHIHAQQSDDLRNTEQRLEWLRAHRASLVRNGLTLNDDMQKELEVALQTGDVSKERFRVLSETIFGLFKVDDNEYMHSIYNMALLDVGVNAALSNCTFDVKREIVLEKMDNGEFIPECTMRVFMKIYSRSSADVVSCRWEAHDRAAYAKAINSMLGDYFDLTEENKEGVPNV